MTFNPHDVLILLLASFGVMSAKIVLALQRKPHVLKGIPAKITPSVKAKNLLTHTITTFASWIFLRYLLASVSTAPLVGMTIGVIIATVIITREYIARDAHARLEYFEREFNIQISIAEAEIQKLSEGPDIHDQLLDDEILKLRMKIAHLKENLEKIRSSKSR